MGLNIKNPGVEADIRRLAELTGESLTSAVQAAVREKIARLEQGEDRPSTITSCAKGAAASGRRSAHCASTH
jgi:hypothetical protein